MHLRRDDPWPNVVSPFAATRIHCRRLLAVVIDYQPFLVPNAPNSFSPPPPQHSLSPVTMSPRLPSPLHSVSVGSSSCPANSNLEGDIDQSWSAALWSHAMRRTVCGIDGDICSAEACCSAARWSRRRCRPGLALCQGRQLSFPEVAAAQAPVIKISGYTPPSVPLPNRIISFLLYRLTYLPSSSPSLLDASPFDISSVALLLLWLPPHSSPLFHSLPRPILVSEPR
ncbi:hypothetical protein C8F01DRAFT_1256716 [Mycena amicta]|nr:hypothetical protein C8F01DRAFT_1256716 [Mycena amicta]